MQYMYSVVFPPSHLVPKVFITSKKILYPLIKAVTPFTVTLMPPTSGNYQPAYCLYGFTYSGCFVWLLPLHIMFLSFICILGCVIVWISTTFCLFVHQLIAFGLFLFGCCDKCCYEHVQIFVRVPVSSSFGYMPKNEIVGHIVILYLTFWETVQLFSTVDAALYISINVQGLKFVHLLTSTGYILCVCSLILAILFLLIGIKFWLVDHFGNIALLTALSLPVHEY